MLFGPHNQHSEPLLLHADVEVQGSSVVADQELLFSAHALLHVISQLQDVNELPLALRDLLRIILAYIETLLMDLLDGFRLKDLGVPV